MDRNRWFSIWKLQSKYTTKPLLFLLMMITVIQGGFLCYYLYQGNSILKGYEGLSMDPNLSISFIGSSFYRFEELLERCYVKTSFWIALWMLVSILIRAYDRQSGNSNVEFTYKRLPLPQKQILNLRILHTVSILFLFYAAQFLLIVLWNLLYQLLLPSTLTMTNSMYLSMLRWDFLYEVFPFFDGLTLLAHCCLLLALAVTIIYEQFMKERGDVKWFPILVVIIYICITFSMNQKSLLILRCILCTLLCFWEYFRIHRALKEEGLVTKV